MKTSMLRPTQMLRVTFGRGTQLFYVLRVSPKGKPFGLRLVGGTWPIALTSLAIDDPRIEAVLTPDEIISYTRSRGFGNTPPPTKDRVQELYDRATTASLFASPEELWAITHDHLPTPSVPAYDPEYTVIGPGTAWYTPTKSDYEHHRALFARRAKTYAKVLSAMGAAV
jgi:hypothetical protein